MRVLALDSATEACSAALFDDGRIDQRLAVIGRGHAERLLPMAHELLQAAGLSLQAIDGIAFGCGPGSFTGLRIAAGIAQGLAAGANRPVLPVSDLAALAAGSARASGDARILACLDARMGEVYWAAFDSRSGTPVRLTEDRLGAPDDVCLPAAGAWRGAGHGFAAWPGLAAHLGLAAVEDGRLPEAADVARLGAADLAAGRGHPAVEAQPRYLRDRVVHRR